MSNWDSLLTSTSGHSVYQASTVDDISGYVFDLFQTDVSMTVDASYAISLIETTAFDDVSAVATINMTAASFSNFFFITVDSSDIDDISANDIIFSIDSTYTNPFTDGGNVAFSNATVEAGNINSQYADQAIKKDMVRHQAFSITGGYAVADIFSNENALVTDISDLDADIHADISGVIDEILAAGGKTTDAFSSVGSDAERFYVISHSLWSINSNDENRISRIHTDLAAASTSTSTTTTIPLKFEPGDAISMRIRYDPKTTPAPGMGGNEISTRSYKILIVLT